MYNRLGINASNINIPVTGINSMQNNITKCVKTTIISKTTNFQANLCFLVIDQIPGTIPQKQINTSTFTVSKDVVLADRNYYRPGKIDLLLGAGFFYDLLLADQIKLTKEGSILQSSKLGWLITGPLNFNYLCTVSCNLYQADLAQQLERFWHIEESETKQIKLTKEEASVVHHFKDHFSKDSSTGRLIVRLPVKENYNVLSDNLDQAIKRFHSLEFKFAKDTELHREYSKFMQEYLTLGHMSKCDHSVNNSLPNRIIYYLPHHFVKKETSRTTKLRVVFDASSRSQSGVSLNDVLKKGPCIQNDIFSFFGSQCKIISNSQQILNIIHVIKKNNAISHRTDF